MNLIHEKVYEEPLEQLARNRVDKQFLLQHWCKLLESVNFSKLGDSIFQFLHNFKVLDTNPGMDRRLEIRIIHKFNPFLSQTRKIFLSGKRKSTGSSFYLPLFVIFY